MAKDTKKKEEFIIPVGDEELLEMFKQDAKVGTEDMNTEGQMPQLKLTHKQSENELQDGSLAKVGTLYHTSLKQSWDDEIDVHVLYVRKAELPDYNGSRMQTNYLVAGVMKEQNVPFLTYIKGMSLRPFWDYEKQIAEFVGHPKYPIPMYALTVTVSVGERESEKYGKIKTINFNVKKDDNNRPVIETDRERIKILKTGVDKCREAVATILSTTADDEGSEVFEENNPAERAAPESADIKEVEDDTIPF